METVRDRLFALKKSNVDLKEYDAIVQQVMTRAVTHLTNEPFYTEIDNYLAQYILTSKALKFV